MACYKPQWELGVLDGIFWVEEPFPPWSLSVFRICSIEKSYLRESEYVLKC